MAILLVRHKVAEYDSWRPAFDRHIPTRKAAGSKSGRIFRNATDPNEVVVITEWDDLADARRFADSIDLKEVMERAGVIDQPDVFFLEEVDQTDA